VTSPSFRRNLELRLGPLVVVLARLPKIVPFALVLALVVAGLIIQGLAGALLLLLVTALLGILLFLAWPALQPPARLVRLAVVVLVLARAVTLL
jgi:hypothetical protein